MKLLGFKFEASQLLTLIGAIGLIYMVLSVPLMEVQTRDFPVNTSADYGYTDFVDGRVYNLVIVGIVAIVLALSGWTKPVWMTGIAAFGMIANELRLMLDFVENTPTFLQAEVIPLHWGMLFGCAFLLILTPFAHHLPLFLKFYRPTQAVYTVSLTQVFVFIGVGVILIGLGVFLPAYSETEALQVASAESGITEGSANLFYGGKAEGVHLLIMIGVILLAAAVRQFEQASLMGIIAAGILINELRHGLVVGYLDIAWFALLIGTGALLALWFVFELVPSDDKQYEALEKLNLRNNLFQNGMGISVPTFSLWFIAAEWDGLRGFFNFVWQAMLSTPRSVQMVVEYFTEVPTYALYPSLVVGAIVGGISTAIYYLIARGHLKLPAPRGNPIWAGILGGIVLYGLGISLGLSLLLLVGIILLSAYGFSRETRQFIVQQTLPPVISPQTVRFLVVGGLIGLGLGAISSQILLYPMQHCPYRVNEAQRFYQDTQLRYGIGITAVSTFILLIPTWTLMQRQGGKKATSTSGYFRNPVLPYIFLAPTLLLLIVFLYYPASELIPLSFRLQPDPINQADSAPVCLENYVRITDSNYTVIDRLPSGREILNTDYPLYENSFTVTLTLTFAIVLFTMILALGIAVLASQKVRGAGIYRTLLVWPYAISPIVTGAVFLAMFRDNSAGVVNWTLETTTGESLKWLKDVDLAPWVIIYAAVWNALGFNILFYIAGLQNIPKDLLEAAAIDGANVFQRFGRITFPLLSPFTFFLLIANITYAFYGIYGAVDVLTDGGPPSEKGGATVGATDILIYKVYNDAFGGSAGSGAAQTVLLFMMVAAITLVQFIFVERRVTYAGD